MAETLKLYCTICAGIKMERNENTMRTDLLARKLQIRSYNGVWNEVRTSQTPLTSNIDCVSGADEIVNLWQKHYYNNLFNCVHSKNPSLLLMMLSSLRISKWGLMKCLKHARCQGVTCSNYSLWKPPRYQRCSAFEQINFISVINRISSFFSFNGSPLTGKGSACDMLMIKSLQRKQKP